MFTQLRFEFKTAPRRVYLALLIALISLFALTTTQTLTKSHGITFFVNGTSATFMSSSDQRQMRHMVKDEAVTEEQLLSQKPSMTVAPAGRKMLKPLIAALKAGDGASANRLALKHITADPMLIELYYSLFFAKDDQRPLIKDFRQVMTYWLQLAPTRLFQVDLHTTALNLLIDELNLTRTTERERPPLLLYGILFIALTTVVSAFFADPQRRPTMLSHTAPLAPNTIAILRSLLVWLVINAGLLLTTGLVVTVLALSPAHDLGLWRFPIQIPHDGLAQIVPLWQMLLRYLGLYNLWFLLFISLAHLVRQITKDASVAMFVLALVPFAGYFHLLDHLPTGLVRWLPSQYVNLPALVNHQLSYVHTTGWFVALVFAGWIIGLWLAATALAAAKRRVRVPLVTND
ncbi:hypothetical protein [Lacticaseibacillus kribbianus]|uniref:hypothetical protein n=1 Tax=Lacticaseibacillus kribbianus TaxID=2926292 RepID=UPI001CD72053|nr:hypothetical protein [Lacticaseibacillus kribbianus]